MKPRFTDGRKGRYRSAEESRAPGYLSRRLKAYARLQRMRERQSGVVTPLKRTRGA